MCVCAVPSGQLERYPVFLDCILSLAYTCQPLLPPPTSADAVDAAADMDVAVANASLLHARCVAYSLLHNCALNHRVLTRSLSRCGFLLSLLVHDCQSTPGSAAAGVGAALSDDGPLVTDDDALAETASCAELLLLLVEGICDDVQLQASGSTADGASLVIAVWAVGGDAVAATPTHHALCDALRAVQAPLDSRAVTWLRAEQCVRVLEGKSSRRGEGLPLWGK